MISLDFPSEIKDLQLEVQNVATVDCKKTPSRTGWVSGKAVWADEQASWPGGTGWSAWHS